MLTAPSEGNRVLAASIVEQLSIETANDASDSAFGSSSQEPMFLVQFTDVQKAMG
jgi:hypothetical protein